MLKLVNNDFVGHMYIYTCSTTRGFGYQYLRLTSCTTFALDTIFLKTGSSHGAKKSILSICRLLVATCCDINHDVFASM